MGVTELIHGTANLPVLLLFAAITQLGDLWFLVLLAGTVYIAGTSFPGVGIGRQRGAFVVALVAVSAVLTTLLKLTFRLPRPPGAAEAPPLAALPSLVEAALVGATTANGYGFPSGHALGATLVWGGLALVVDRWTLRRRLVAAGVVVVLVSLSRLVLGVHYLVDVLAGVGVGLIVLVTLYRLSDRGTDAGRVLLAAVLIGAVGAYRYPTFETVATFAGSLGAWLVWRAIDTEQPARPSSTAARLVAVGVAGLAGVLFIGLSLLQPPLQVTVMGATLAGGLAMGSPYVADRVV